MKLKLSAKIKLALLTIFILALMTISTVTALTISGKTGNWNITTSTQINADSNSTLSQIYYTYPYNSSFFSSSLNVSSFYVPTPPIISGLTVNPTNSQNFYESLGITDSSGNTTYLNLFNLWSTKIYFSVLQPANYKEAYYYPTINNMTDSNYYNIGYGNNNFTLNMGFTISGNILTLLGSTYSQNINSNSGLAIQFTSSGYLIYSSKFSLTDTNITSVTLYFAHVGTGNFNINILSPTGELMPNGNYGVIGVNGATFNNINLIPEPFRSIFADLLTVIGFMITALGWIMQIIIWIIPFTPYIALLYFIDLVYTSIKEGSFQPIGNGLLGVWGALLVVATVLSYIGNFLWSIAQTAGNLIGKLLEFLGLATL